MLRNKPYPGETRTKSLSRARQYTRARQLFDVGGGLPRGWAVVLAGPEAREVDSLLSLGWSPRKILLVDNTWERGMVRAKRRLPSIRTYFGNIQDILPSLKDEGIGFINLDFMGYMKEEEESALRALNGVLVPGAVVYYTFTRGREVGHHTSWNLTRSAAIEALINDNELIKLVKSREQVRFLGYVERMKTLIELPYLYFILGTRYSRITGKSRSHLGVVGVQYMPAFKQTDKWRQVVEDLSLSGKVV
jgi:hypothetical protein